MEKSSKFRIFLYSLGALTLILGIWGFILRFTVGERAANYGSYVPWGLWVAIYLFFAGIAAGGYMVACLEYLFGISLFKGTGKVALWGSLVALPVGLMTIGLDLGHIERIWKVFLNPSFGSIMAQMVWGYSIFLVVILISLWLTIRTPLSKIIKPVFIFGLFLSVFLSGGVGAFLGVNASRSFWHVGLLPAQFPFFSLASGVALLLLVLGWLAPGNSTERLMLLRALGIATIVLALIKLFFLWADFSQSIYAGVPENVEAVRAVLFGKFWWVFWFIQIGIGTLLPIVLLAFPKTYTKKYLVGTIGLLVLVGFAIARVNIVLPGLIVPEFEGLSSAFQGPHLNYDYFPSLMEWLVVAGGVGIAVLVFLIGSERLPLWLSRVNQTPEVEVKND